jgi:hypothetical protein
MILAACVADEASDTEVAFDHEVDLVLEETDQALWSNGPDANKTVQRGDFGYLDSYTGEGYGDVAGKAVLVRKRDGSATGSIAIFGLPADAVFMSHLHAAPCSEGAGPHYQDPACSEEGCEVNNVTEIWPGFTTDANGRGVGLGSVAWQPSWRDLRNLSIVVHDTPNNGGSGAGPKMLCADLEFSRTAWGAVTYTNETTPGVSPSLRYGVMVRRFSGSTTAFLSWRGLRDNFKYPSHVHASACDFNNGGPHYVRDIECLGGGCEVSAETEFWTGFTSNRRGAGWTSTTIPGIARADATSLVLHDCLDENGDPDYSGTCAGGKPRMACVDFH